MGELQALRKLSSFKIGARKENLEGHVTNFCGQKCCFFFHVLFKRIHAIMGSLENVRMQAVNKPAAKHAV